jgi:outer membrane protein
MFNNNYFKMKKISVVLFVVLFLAVAVLYFFQFKGSGKSANANSSGASGALPGGGIAYVNIDSVIINLDLFRDRRAELMTKQKNAEAELNSKGTQYERGVKDYQDKVNKGLVTRANAAQIEQGLLQQQQELVSLRDKLQSNLVEEEQVMNRQVLEYITKFIEDNKVQYNYQFILGKSFGGPVLYSNSSLDMTQQLLSALNKKYQSEKK